MGIVEARGLSKDYYRAKTRVPVLHGVDLNVSEGEFVALMGPSGSGKSTLLNLMAGLDEATSGTLSVAGADLGSMSERARTKWRTRNIGLIFQLYNLIPVLNAVRNVELPLLLTGLGRKERRQRAELALDIVGLGDRKDHYPNELSGGQEQRVAIARALVTDPRILLADEPTGDLDRATSEEILGILALLNDKHGKTIVMVTHDAAAARRAGRRLMLESGRVVLQESSA
ncbi:MAG: ABC transporter ATP-binding protein [Candidatus Schekmanbacteria bacterium]|nr:ABC transporter ATP-binding protein [Candidatus Schekmanbacteria bacterium]